MRNKTRKSTLFFKINIYISLTILLCDCSNHKYSRPLFNEVKDTVYLNNENWFYISDVPSLKVKQIDFYKFSFSLLDKELLEDGLIGFDSTKIFFTNGEDLETFVDFSVSINHSIKTENTSMTLFYIDSVSNIFYFLFEQYLPIYLHSSYEGAEVWVISKEKGIIDNCYCSKFDSIISIKKSITDSCNDSIIIDKLNESYEQRW